MNIFKLFIIFALFGGLAAILIIEPGENPEPSKLELNVNVQALSVTSSEITSLNKAQTDAHTSNVQYTASRALPEWLREYRQMRNPNLEMLEEGRRIAEARRNRMLELIQNDPDAALDSMLSLTEYAALPEDVRSRVEQPFSATSNLEVIYSCPDSTHSEHVAGNHRSVTYSTQLDGEIVEVFPARDRRGIQSKSMAFLSGVRLDGIAAVHSEPIWVIPKEEAESIESVLNIPITDSAQGKEIALAGSVPLNTSLLSHVEQINALVQEAESLPGPDTVEVLAAALRDAPKSGFNAKVVRRSVQRSSQDWTTADKAMLFIRIDFDDIPGEPVSIQELSEELVEVAAFYKEASFGQVAILPTITPQTYRLGHSSEFDSREADFRKAIASSAKEAASIDYSLDDFDIYVFCFPNLSDFGSAGRGTLGGALQWLNGSFSRHTIAHETGHNFGLDHASSWDASFGSNPAEPDGSITWYGNPFDVMGSGDLPLAHFNSLGKRNLNWIEESDYLTVTESGSYRLYRHDHIEALGGGRHLGLKVQFTSGPVESHPFWVSYRQLFKSSPDLRYGPLIAWDEFARDADAFGGRSDYRLLDMIPGSLLEKEDSPLPLDQTFADPTGLVQITPVARGGTPPHEWIDVNVQLGVIGNKSPTVDLTGPGEVSARIPVTFVASASDPDGDEVHYSWDFGDGTRRPGTSSRTHVFLDGGTFEVIVHVSDLKGGDVNSTLSISVSDPLDPWVEPETGITDNLSDVTYAQGRFVACGLRGNLFSSLDGFEWRSHSIDILGYGIAEGAGEWVVVGSDYSFSTKNWEGRIQSSRDLNSWVTEKVPEGLRRFNRVAYGNGIWIAVEGEGPILRKVGGDGWTANSLGNSLGLLDVAFGNGFFIAVGYNKTLLRSSDGLMWNSIAGNTGLAGRVPILEVAFADGLFAVSGSGTGIQISKDNGDSWTGANLPSNYTIGALAVSEEFVFGSGYFHETRLFHLEKEGNDVKRWNEK